MVSSEPKPQRAATRFIGMPCSSTCRATDGARRRHAGRPAIVAHEAALAHRRGTGERGDREIGAQMIGDPGMQPLEPGVALLQGERRAELRLTARAFEKDDKLARDRERERLTEIRLDERERE